MSNIDENHLFALALMRASKAENCKKCHHAVEFHRGYGLALRKIDRGTCSVVACQCPYRRIV